MAQLLAAAVSRRQVTAALLALVGANRMAAAEATYPSRLVRLIVPNAAGSSPDVIARQLGAALERRWRQPVVVELVHAFDVGLFHVAALVRHLVDERGYAAALAAQAKELGPLLVMEPAERELRVELEPLFASGALRQVKNPKKECLVVYATQH